MLELRRCWTFVEVVENRKGPIGERKAVRNFHFLKNQKKKNPAGL